VHLVATVHNLRPHATGDALPRYRERLAWLWARRLDAVFVHEGVGLAMAARKLRVPPERLIEIRHGVFDERCPPPLREDRSLLFFGKWRRNKGLVQLIEALADLADWRLLVAGPADDAAYADLSRSLATPNVEFDERFIPEHEIAEVFARASACVLPYTKMDAQSGVLHLAIGSGRPVVVTPVGGMASVVREFGCGVVAASSAPADLRAFDEETFAAATVGVASAREHLGWGAAARATIDGYRRVSGI
jgi:glycosyltransferase involved in cell wall biosynthesis